MKEVSLASSYAGAKSEAADAEFFDRVAVISADAALLTRFWHETAGIITGRLQPFIVAAGIDDDRLTLKMEMSGSYDESLNTSVEADLFSSLSTGVTARWFRYSFPARAAEWEKESLDLLERAFRKLCHRIRPQRKTDDTL